LHRKAHWTKSRPLPLNCLKCYYIEDYW
jgi:hypothetical protein